MKKKKKMIHNHLPQKVNLGKVYSVKMKKVLQEDYSEIQIILKNKQVYLKNLKKVQAYLVIRVEVYLEISNQNQNHQVAYLVVDYLIFLKLIKKKMKREKEREKVREMIIQVNQTVQNMNIILKMIKIIKKIKMDILKDILKKLIMLYYMIN